MSDKDIEISVSEVTVTSSKVTVGFDGSPSAGATYSLWYDDVSYADETRDRYKWHGGHVEIVTTEIVVSGLKPGTTYYIRVFEVNPGNPQEPNTIYDYSEELSFTTNKTLVYPRLSNAYCTETPASGPGPGDQVNENSTSMRIGCMHQSYGTGTVADVAYEFSWSFGGGIQTSTGDLPYYDTSDMPELTAGDTIEYEIFMTVTYDDASIRTASIQGYTFVFKELEDTGDVAYVPAELFVQSIWQSMRPEYEKTFPDGPIVYFSGIVRNNNGSGIGNAIVTYTQDPTEESDKWFYVVTSNQDAELGTGTFVIDSDVNAPLIYAPEFLPSNPPGMYDSMSVRFAVRLERWKYNTHYPYVHDSMPGAIGPPIIAIMPSHICTKESIKASSACSKLKFKESNNIVPVLSNDAYANIEPEYLLLHFDISELELGRGIVRAFVRLFARESRIDKTLTSTVFAMACDEAGEILTGDDGNPIAFSSAEIALINYVSHTVPVEPIIDYFVGQGETDIYIRLQLGAAFVQTEHSGTDVIGDSGYVSFWSAEYGKEWAIEVQSGDITITETYFDDSYAPSLEIYQTGKEVEEDDALNTRIFASSPVPLTTEVYEYQRWNGVRMVDDIHDLVASYSNTLSWNVVNFLAPPQPVGLDYFKPVYFVLRWGGFRNHALQPGLVINGKSELTENLGLNELEEGLIYTGNYPLTFITVGAVFQEGFVSRGSTRTLTFTDRSTGRYEDFDPLGVRNTESIEQGGVPSGIYPGEEMHYYYRILQHGIWGIEAWPAEEWINSFKSNYGLTMKEIPQITEGSIIFSGSQIDQDKIRRIVSGL